jgi:hypothetical protein
MRALLAGIVAMATLALVSAQDLRDFTRSPTEHIINQLENPFLVRAVAGVIVLKGGGDPLPNALLELQGPGKSKKIRSVTADENGRFTMRRVPRGAYKFKATLNGFQSVVGTMVVSKTGPAGPEIRIEMPFGV